MRIDPLKLRVRVSVYLRASAPLRGSPEIAKLKLSVHLLLVQNEAAVAVPAAVAAVAAAGRQAKHKVVRAAAPDAAKQVHNVVLTWLGLSGTFPEAPLGSIQARRRLLLEFRCNTVSRLNRLSRPPGPGCQQRPVC